MNRVVIVGGGVIGTMHALFARRRGMEVVQLERDPAPREASVRNFGLVWVSGRASGAELAMALRARALWEEIGTAVPDVGFRPDGSLTVAMDQLELAVMAEVCAGEDGGARGVELLDGDGVRSCNPAVTGAVAGGMYCRHDAVVEPSRVLPALRAYLARDGGYEFFGGRQARDAATGVVTDHTGARHSGDLVLLCTGASLSGVGGQQLAGAPLRRCRLQMMETAPFSERLTTSLADGHSMRYYPAFDVPALSLLAPAPDVVTRHRMQLLVAQRADGSLTIGDTHSYDEPFAVAVEDEPYDWLRSRAEAILGRRIPPVVRRWEGIYSLTTDGTVLYRHEVEPGVLAITGLAGRGMTLSPAVAEQTWAGLAA
jgi:FAD dependent oxidoreductase TIGR03364